jgi:hypothetical protein
MAMQSAWAMVQNLVHPRRKEIDKFVHKALQFSEDGPKEAKFDKAAFFRSVAAGGGSISEATREFAKLAFGPGRLKVDEYARYRLYENRLSFDEKLRFMSDDLHWSLVAKVCDPTYDALTEDKFISYKLLASFGLPVPTTLAVVTSGPRTFPGAVRIETAESLFDFVAASDAKLFFKPNTGIGSFAAFACDGVRGDRILTRPHGEKLPAEILEILAGRDFLVQERLVNHPAIAAFTPAIATVRMTNFLIDGKVNCPIALMKIPVGDNVADNFWRPGNLLANIDARSGEIVRAMRGAGPQTEELSEHPDTGAPLVGFQVPFWDDLLELNRSVALALAPLPFTSLDIAINEHGPLVVEVNTGGSFDLPQRASGSGLLTPEIKAFFGL